MCVSPPQQPGSRAAAAAGGKGRRGKPNGPAPGSREATLAAKKPGAFSTEAFEKALAARVLRAGSKSQTDSAALRESKTKGGKSGGQYKHFAVEDMMQCVRIRTKHRRAGDTPMSYAELHKKYGCPKRSVQNHEQRMTHYREKDAKTGHYKKDAQDNYIWIPRTVPLKWDDPQIYDVSPGNERTVPPSVMVVLVGLLSMADAPHMLKGASRCEADQLLLGLMDAGELPYPESWSIRGAASDGWWRWFFQQKEAEHLSEGYPRRLEEIRLTAQTPEAVNGWFDKMLKPDPGYFESEPEHWRGQHGVITVQGMEHYLRKEMPQFITSKSDAEVRQLAYEMCHDARRQACFDQKGHVRKPALSLAHCSSECSRCCCCYCCCCRLSEAKATSKSSAARASRRRNATLPMAAGCRFARWCLETACSGSWRWLCRGTSRRSVPSRLSTRRLSLRRQLPATWTPSTR